MKNLFIPYAIAKLLKDKGFDDECFNAYYEKKNPFYINDEMLVYQIKPNTKHNFFVSSISNYNEGQYERAYISAPLYQQVVDWFREKHNIHIGIGLYYDGYDIDVRNFNNDTHFETQHEVLEYYEALNKAIGEALKLIK